MEGAGTTFDYVNNLNDVTVIDEQIAVSNKNKVLTVILCVIGTFGFLSNLMVVLVILQYPKMRRMLHNIYVIDQSIIDSLAGFMLLFTTLFEDDGKTNLFSIADDAMCRLWFTKVPLWAMLFSSTYNLVALTLERYMSVVHPIKHRLSVTKAKVMVSIAIVWMIGFCIQIPLKVTTGYIKNGRCHQMQRWESPLVKQAMGVLMVVIQFFLPLAIIAFCYCRMYLVLRGNVVIPAEGQTGTAGQESVQSKATIRARKNIFKTLLIVSACFILCWVWNQGYFLIVNLGLIKPDFTSAFYYSSIGAVSVNCCINPIIYIIHYDQFKRALQHLKRRFVADDNRQEDGNQTVTQSIDQVRAKPGMPAPTST